MHPALSSVSQLPIVVFDDVTKGYLNEENVVDEEIKEIRRLKEGSKDEKIGDEEDRANTTRKTIVKAHVNFGAEKDSHTTAGRQLNRHKE